MFKPFNSQKKFSIAVFLILLSLLVVSSISFAAIPRYLSAQAKVTDKATGGLLDGSFSVTFRIYSASSGGTALWEETQTITINDGILDSFDIMSIISEFEEAFKIEIPAAEIIPDNLNSAEAMWNMVQRLMER